MKTQLKGLLITITGASMWGFCAVAGKYVMGTKGVDPVWMVTLRLLLAGTILLTIAFIKEKRVAPAENRGHHFFDIWKDKKSILRLLVVAVFAFAVCQTTYFAAIDLSNAGITTAIQQTSPVFVLLWVMLLEKRSPKKVEVLVIAMVVFGAFVLATGGDIGALLIPLNALILGVISAITCAMYTVLPGKLIERYGTFYAIGWGMILAGILLVPIAKLWIVSGTWDIGTILAFGFVVIFGTVTAFAAYLYGITLVGPLMGSVLGLVEPVVAAFASALLLKQVFSITDIIGIVAILGGVTILSIYKGKGEE